MGGNRQPAAIRLRADLKGAVRRGAEVRVSLSVATTSVAQRMLTAPGNAGPHDCPARASSAMLGVIRDRSSSERHVRAGLLTPGESLMSRSSDARLRADGPAREGPRFSRRSERPVLHPDLVRRDGLLAWFADHRAEPVVALVAPAGYGKTTLLAQAAEADER